MVNFDETWYKASEFQALIFCSNDNPVLILTYFTARSNFATSAFIWENVTMMDTSEITAMCDLEFGLLCKLNDQMMDYELRSRFAQSF